MYLAHYKLNKKPFDISPDPEFLWLGEKHQEGLATLNYGILENKGFLMITGDVGTGKTALIRAIEKAVQARIIVVSIPDPSLTLMDFYNVMASELNMNRTFENKGAFLIEFKRIILQAGATHRRVLLIIDEAHRLSSPLLEEIRLLSNIDLGGKVMINTFFVGQLEFKTLVARPENRAVRQRIAVSYELLPLTLEETQQYIAHRLKVSGATRPIFTPEAARLVHGLSRGYPRLINIICDHALLSGFTSGEERIGPEVIKECGEELRITLRVDPPEEKKTPAPANPTRPPAAIPTHAEPVEEPASHAWRRAAAAAALVALAGSAWYFGGERISNELARWGKGSERSTVQSSQAPVESGAKPERASAAAAEDSLKLASKPAPEASPVLEGSSAVKKENPAAMTRLPGAPVAAPGAPRGRAQADTRPPVKAEAQLASPGTPPATPAAEAAKAAVAVAGPPATKEPLGLKEFTIYFAKNSTDIPIYAQDILATAANLLKRFPETQAVIEGHTDSIGDPVLNKAISEERAASVKDYLVDQKIRANRISVLGYGPEKPIESNSTAEGRSKNRRVSIRIVTVKPR